MKVGRSLTITFIFFLVCGAYAEEQYHPTIHGVTLRMEEVAKDGIFNIYPEERFQKVDVSAILRLRFDTQQTLLNFEKLPKWRALSEALDRLNKAAKDYQQLAKRSLQVQNTKFLHDSKFTEEVDRVSKEAVGILTYLVSQPPEDPLFTRYELTQIAKTGFEEPYIALAEVINNKREELHRRAAKLKEDAKKYFVVLRAFLIPKGGQRQSLHIPFYDNLPQGDFRSLNPLAILPSQEEFRRLLSELEASRKVATAIREIRRKGSLIIEDVKQLLTEIKSSVEKIVQDLQSEILQLLPDDWGNILDSTFLEELSQLDIPGSDAPTVLSKCLEEIRKDIMTFLDMFNRIQDIKDKVQNLLSPGGVPFPEIESIVKNINTLNEKRKELEMRIPQWEEHFLKIQEVLPNVIGHVMNESGKGKLESFRASFYPALEKFKEELVNKLPETMKVIAELSEFFNRSKILESANGMIALDPEASTYIPHPLEELKTAELDLRYTGIVVGDNIIFTVEFRPDDSSIKEEQIKPPDVVYNAEATHAGLHRRYDTSVIFSRTFNGQSSDSFQPNFSLSLEWHYFHRKNPNSILNILDPGIGFHAAFLQHDDENNFEFGGGINISLLSGFIRIGYGYNISSKENNQYWFIGFNLFELLGQFREEGSRF